MENITKNKAAFSSSDLIDRTRGHGRNQMKIKALEEKMPLLNLLFDVADHFFRHDPLIELLRSKQSELNRSLF